MHPCYNLKNRETIRKFFALVLLLIFTFSATPKKYLHDLVADHSDFYGVVSGDDSDIVTKTGFNCHCEDLVVSIPFIQTTFSTDFSLSYLYEEFAAASYRQFNLITKYTKDLRGPPGVA